MDGKRVVWTRVAIQQRDYVFDYWNKRNKSKRYSTKLNKGIRERLEILSKMPKLGMLTNKKDYRVFFYKYYGIHYKISEDLIYVVGFWDNRQNPEKLIEFLKPLA